VERIFERRMKQKREWGRKDVCIGVEACIAAQTQCVWACVVVCAYVSRIMCVPERVSFHFARWESFVFFFPREFFAFLSLSFSYTSSSFFRLSFFPHFLLISHLY
jgi:hypothetical protein